MKHHFNSKTIATLFILSLLLLGNKGYGRDFKNSPYNHRIVSFNTGYAFSGSGDCWGIGNEISHLKTIAPILFHRESISSWIINGSSWIDGGYEHQTGFDFTLELGISPLMMKNRLLSFTFGGCVSNQFSRGPNGGGIWNDGNGGYKQVVNYRTDKLIDPGFTLGLNYHSSVNSKLWLNARAAVRAYNSGAMLSILSVGIGFDPSKLKK
jgi:hypothetical protein